MLCFELIRNTNTPVGFLLTEGGFQGLRLNPTEGIQVFTATEQTFIAGTHMTEGHCQFIYSC